MSIRSFLSQQYRRIWRTWDFFWRESALLAYVPRGHFSSPLPDLADGQRMARKAFERPVMDSLPGLNLRVDAQNELLMKIVTMYPQFDWSEQRIPGRRFHLKQDWYKQADSICLYSMLRLFRPRQIVEVGSGFSSALMLDVNDRFLEQGTRLTFVEPYPDRLEALLTVSDKAHTRIIRQSVQNISMDVFCELESGDLLFIDSSHTAKVGSDVNFLFFEILPRLPVGAFVHLHDIFWPFEYPAEWIATGQAWNESYLLRAFLSFNDAFEIVFWVPFVTRRWPDLIRERMPDMIDKGAAIWLRRVR
jgi:predicted O-methyltransferase YrrM